MKANPSEDALTIRYVVSQAKDTELKSQVKGGKLKAADSEEGLRPAEKQLQDFSLLLAFLFSFLMASATTCNASSFD